MMSVCIEHYLLLNIKRRKYNHSAIYIGPTNMEHQSRSIYEIMNLNDTHMPFIELHLEERQRQTKNP